jgi:hypothetical protein
LTLFRLRLLGLVKLNLPLLEFYLASFRSVFTRLDSPQRPELRQVVR